ncbi:hypothetical protein YC2023_120823 [Brassica napus]
MAVKLANMIGDIQPTVKDIQYCGLELIPHRQLQLCRFADTLARGRKLAERVERRFGEIDRNLHSLNEQLATSEVHFDRMDMNFDRLRRCIRDCCSGLRWFTLIISSGLILLWFKG